VFVSFFGVLVPFAQTGLRNHFGTEARQISAESDCLGGNLLVEVVEIGLIAEIR
jgi:hypothetical protein